MDVEICLDTTPLVGKLKDFLPLHIINVSKTEMEPLWDYMVKNYHYLGYDSMIGPRIKYLVLHQGRPIAALSFNRAALRVGVRDRHIGWDTQQKNTLLCHVVNNNRFLILPWVSIKNLASHLLSRTLKILRTDWPFLFGTKPYLIETFVDQEKYKGTCYKAANWLFLGETQGFAKVGKTFVYHGNRKGVYIYVLQKDFIENIRLTPRHQPLKKVRERVPNMMLHTPDWSPTILQEAGVTEENVACLGKLLDEYLANFSNCYTRSEQENHGDIYVKGLLSDLERKSIEPIAIRYQGEGSVRAMQNFSQHGIWDYQKLSQDYTALLSATFAEQQGMINVDGCDNPKKGKESVGAARQYCGSLGKTENCQSGVFVGYSSSKGYGLIEGRLYMPEKWFSEEYEERRHKCGVPEDLVFQTKIKIASDMINDAVKSGLFPAMWIGADSFFGNNKEFLDSLPKGLFYFANIHSNAGVFRERPTMVIPEYSGKGRKELKPRLSAKPASVSSIVQDSSIPWVQVVLGEGAKGPIIAAEKCLRVVECRDDLPRNEVWLYIRRHNNGEIKYALCNAPADMPLDSIRKASTMRWPIEQCFEECKTCLGMDHLESRSWNSWHRHMLFVFIAHLFLQQLRLRFKKKPVQF